MAASLEQCRHSIFEDARRASGLSCETFAAAVRRRTSGERRAAQYSRGHLVHMTPEQATETLKLV